MKQIILSVTLAALFACGNISAKAASANSLNTGSGKVDPKQDLLNPPSDHPPKVFSVTVWVNVPHNTNCTESLRAMPYLTELPKANKVYNELPETYSSLKGSLYSYGFSNRLNRGIHAYNGSGWRFTYALDAAVREAGLGYPHTLLEANTWCEEMYPYLKKYITRINEAEGARSDRYRRANADYQDKHLEIEYEALRQGLYPIDFTCTTYHLSLRRGIIKLREGTWWITGFHKVVGLKYYWQEELTVGEGQTNAVELNEANAILIDGDAW